MAPLFALFTESSYLVHGYPELVPVLFARPLNFKDPMLSAHYALALEKALLTFLESKKLAFIVEEIVLAIMKPDNNYTNAEVAPLHLFGYLPYKYKVKDVTVHNKQKQAFGFFQRLRGMLRKIDWQDKHIVHEVQRCFMALIPILANGADCHVLVDLCPLILDAKLLGVAFVSAFIKKLADALKNKDIFIQEDD